MLKSLPSWEFLLISGLLTTQGLSSPSFAGQLANGQTFFDKTPLLLEASTTYKEIWVWAAKYYFTVSLPADAGEPLKQLVIQQKPSPEMLDFYPDQTVAFVGSRDNRGNALTLQSSQWNPDNNTMTVIFDPPVPPGTTVTVGLKPYRNPSVSGIYLFGVTAVPDGSIAAPMYLGVGRLQFYQTYW
ncbi:MAG: DUF2808 domain-containing protein [Snowella sp.]|nr:DUF2808 domain-containing protein [Snowella sp.]